MVQPDRPQLIIWRMRIVCRMPEVTDIHSEYVTLIGFPRQNWLHDYASVLNYTFIACLVEFTVLKIFC